MQDFFVSVFNDQSEDGLGDVIDAEVAEELTSALVVGFSKQLINKVSRLRSMMKNAMDDTKKLLGDLIVHCRPAFAVRSLDWRCAAFKAQW